VRSLVPPLRSLIAIDVVLWVVTVFINRANRREAVGTRDGDFGGGGPQN
jgi:hypothetical protein